MTRAAALLATALGLVLVSCPHAWAGAPTDALRDAFSAVSRALDDPELRKTPTDLRAAIRSALVARIDSREAARRALGNEWMARTSAERDEFAALFGDHFERTYVFRIAAHAPMHRGLAIRYVDEKIDGRTATVATALGNREGGEVPVEYRLIQRDGRWAIFDVVIDGASLVDNYKTLFSRVIGQSSYPDVVALMKPRPSEVRAAAAPSAKASEPRPATPAPSAATTTDAPPTPSPAPVAATPMPAAVAPAPAVMTPQPIVPTPAPAVATPAQVAPSPALAVAPVVAAQAPVAAAPTAPSPAAPVAAPVVATPTPLAATPAPVITPPTPKLARLVADHASAKPPAPVPTVAYWLQVGAFKNPDAAGGLATRLRAQSLPVSIDSVTVPPGPRGTPLSRVRVGPFADQAEAAAKLRELETSGYRPFLAVERRSN